ISMAGCGGGPAAGTDEGVVGMPRPRLRRTTLVGAAVLLVAVSGLVPGAANAAPGHDAELPLGTPGLPQTVTVQQVLPGVTLTTYVRGSASADAFWYVRAGFLGTRDAAQALAARLGTAGQAAEVEEVDGRPVDDPVRGPDGYLVR